MAESGLWRLNGTSWTSVSFWESSCNVPHGKVPSFCPSVFLTLPLLMEKFPRLLALLNGNGRLKFASVLDFPLRDICRSGCVFRGLEGEGKGELTNTEFSEMLELVLSREQVEEQEQVLLMTGTSRFRLPVVFLSKGCKCLLCGFRKESSEFCFLRVCSSYSLAEEQSSWLRARNWSSFTPTKEKMAGSELRRSTGLVTVSKISSEEWEWLTEHWIWIWGHAWCVCPVASQFSPSVLSESEWCWCEGRVSVSEKKKKSCVMSHLLFVADTWHVDFNLVKPSRILVSVTTILNTEM